MKIRTIVVASIALIGLTALVAVVDNTDLSNLRIPVTVTATKPQASIVQVVDKPKESRWVVKVVNRVTHTDDGKPITGTRFLVDDGTGKLDTVEFDSSRFDVGFMPTHLTITRQANGQLRVDPLIVDLI